MKYILFLNTLSHILNTVTEHKMKYSQKSSDLESIVAIRNYPSKQKSPVYVDWMVFSNIKSRE
jgi:hypothetical protein